MKIEACRHHHACKVAKWSSRRHNLLPLAWALRIAAHNLDLVGDDRLSAVLHLELDVLDQESPDLVAESVGVERALYMVR